MGDAVRCDLELHADLKDLTQPVFIQATGGDQILRQI
ncbi:hypothetical protein PspLS_04551 [Pyricularia sp. CBS 133598]|nr:hypothetical protein PspLS_04551 [Pyricularia sp. CBS 133598]